MKDRKEWLTPIEVEVETTSISVPVERLTEETIELFQGLAGAEARLSAANGEAAGQREAAFGALYAVYMFVENLGDESDESRRPYTVLRMLMTALIDLREGCQPPPFLQPPTEQGRRGAPPASGRQKHIKSAAVACFHALHLAGESKSDSANRVARVFNQAGLQNDLPQSRADGISARAVQNWASGSMFGSRKRPSTAMVLESNPSRVTAEKFLAGMAQMLSHDQSYGRSAQKHT